MAGSYQAILLPGAVLPAELAYGPLVAALRGEAVARPKDLEVYRGDGPGPGYALDAEIEGVLREAERARFERFHLVGYSGGGAVAAAFAARHPERLSSLALLEPAWVGWEGMSEPERRLWDEYLGLDDLPPDELMRAFVRMQVRPGVEPPPQPDPPPAWMAARPAGIRAITRAFLDAEIALDALRRFERPVYYALGGLSNPDQFERQARRLEAVFEDFTLEVFPERHHFDPPHRIEPEWTAAALLSLWRRAERGALERAF